MLSCIHYLATEDYKDKSGSYGIQSYIGQFIRRIDGFFYSVMGLPLNLEKAVEDVARRSSVLKIAPPCLRATARRQGWLPCYTARGHNERSPNQADALG